jgi:hypothetical protein
VARMTFLTIGNALRALLGAMPMQSGLTRGPA